MSAKAIPIEVAAKIGGEITEAIHRGDRRLAMSLVDSVLPDPHAVFREHGNIRSVPVGDVFEMRVANMLAFDGMPTCGHVLSRSRDELIEQIPQMGPKTAAMIVREMKELVVRWNSYVASVRQDNT